MGSIRTKRPIAPSSASGICSCYAPEMVLTAPTPAFPPAARPQLLVGVEKRTGRVVWQVVGPSPRVLHGQWSSPSVARVGDKTLAFFGGGDGWLYALDVRTGREQWRFDGNPKEAVWRPSSDVGGVPNRNIVIACPVFDGGRVYLTMGEDPTHGDGAGRLYAIAADGSGDITTTGRVWEYHDLHRTICTPIIHDGLIYVGDNYGQVHCVDLQTGQRVWANDQMSRIWGCMVLRRRPPLRRRRGRHHLRLSGGPKNRRFSPRLKCRPRSTAPPPSPATRSTSPPRSASTPSASPSRDKPGCELDCARARAPSNLMVVVSALCADVEPQARRYTRLSHCPKKQGLALQPEMREKKPCLKPVSIPALRAPNMARKL